MEVLGDLSDGHEMQNLRAEQTRPVAPHVLESPRREHHVRRVEQVLLSRIHGVSHLFANLPVN